MAGETPNQDLPNPLLSGLLMRCPVCAKGPLFEGYLQTRERCKNCDADFSNLDTGDGPAVFIMLIVSVLVLVPALFLELAYQPAWWVHAATFLPVMIALPLMLLRPAKAIMFAAQYRFRAAEGRVDEKEAGDQ